MKERIYELRKALNLGQEEFGKRIGITRSSVSGFESGRRNPSTQTITSICKEFNVNKSWLINGTGEMFIRDEDKELDSYISELANGDVLKKNLVKAICELSDSEWNILKKILTELTNH